MSALSFPSPLSPQTPITLARQRRLSTRFSAAFDRLHAPVRTAAVWTMAGALLTKILTGLWAEVAFWVVLAFLLTATVCSSGHLAARLSNAHWRRRALTSERRLAQIHHTVYECERERGGHP